MKRKGFTLIELLAVIVVLAIIALIVTPLVMNTIRNAKKGASERGANNYARSVETKIAESLLQTDKIEDGSYSVTNDGKIKKGDKEYEIEVKGTKPTKGQVVIKDKSVVGYTLMMDGEYVYSDNFANGQEVYYNPIAGTKCSDYVLANSATERKTGCMKFYAFNDSKGADRVNLLLDHNTTDKIEWNSSGDNTSGSNELISALASDTTGWIAEVPGTYTDPVGYTINYSTNARLITANELVAITGYSDWNQSYYYFDTNDGDGLYDWNANTYTGYGRYGWLYDKTSTDCETYGCNNNADTETYGYWTSSAFSDENYFAWYVYHYGSLDFRNSISDNSYGVRPVIEVLKSNL